jgi:hypothetical protein
MAKGHDRNAGYIPGDNWNTCDRCGFERRVSEMREEWTGLQVCSDTCWEPRHPQDFLRVREDSGVPATPGTQDGTSNLTAYASGRNAVAGIAVAGTAVAGAGGTVTIPFPGTFNTNTL